MVIVGYLMLILCTEHASSNFFKLEKYNVVSKDQIQSFLKNHHINLFSSPQSFFSIVTIP